jgi:uncharacterized protein YkwD
MQMFWALITAVCLYLAAGIAPLKAETRPNPAPKSSRQQVSPYDDPSHDNGAEKQLLEKANRDRARAGLSPLQMDEGLSRAARVHAARMAAQGELSHQFLDERSLLARLSANSTLHLERAGENVAVAPTADDAHRALMASPPHRDNLLNKDFNVAGIGVVRKGAEIYVAQDFGVSQATYSLKQAEELVAAGVDELRAQSNMPRLERVSNRGIETSACAMAQADSLNATRPPPGATMLRYTSMKPESLPANISKVIAQRGLRTYSAGICYARTGKYPNGAYWVVMVFY